VHRVALQAATSRRLAKIVIAETMCSCASNSPRPCAWSGFMCSRLQIPAKRSRS
jgi:hypothetical protein